MSKNAFIAQLDNVLKPLGFVRHATTWNRRTKSVVEVIDVQVSKAGDAITVNAGVLDPEVHATMWGSAPAEFVEQPSCTVGVRVGELVNGSDIWWRLSDAAAVADVERIVTTSVLSFLERMRAREAMKQWLTDTEVIKKKYPPPIITLAIIMSLLGETLEACALLAELHKKPVGAWRARIAETAGRLSC